MGPKEYRHQDELATDHRSQYKLNLTLSKRINTVGVSLPSCSVSSCLEFWTMGKVYRPSDSEGNYEIWITAEERQRCSHKTVTFISVIFVIGNDARTCFRSANTALKRYATNNANSDVITTRENVFTLHCAMSTAGEDWLFVSLLNWTCCREERTDSLKFKSDGVDLVDVSSRYLYRLAGCNRPVSSAINIRSALQDGMSKQKRDPKVPFVHPNTDIPIEEVPLEL